MDLDALIAELRLLREVHGNAEVDIDDINDHDAHGGMEVIGAHYADGRVYIEGN